MTFDECMLKVLLDGQAEEKEQREADVEAIRHELETVWEAINELQGVDPERIGEPDA